MQEVANFAGLSYETVRRAAVEYDRTGGRSGLKTERRTPTSARRVHVAERDRWISGQKPVSTKRRVRAA
jgi:transposase